MDRIDGMDKEEVEVHFFPQGFLHNSSSLKIKVFSKEKTYLSIPTNGVLWWTWFDDLEIKVSKLLLNLWQTTAAGMPAMPL